MARTLNVLPSRITAGETLWVSAENTMADNPRNIYVSGFTPSTHALAYQFAASTPVSAACEDSGDGGWTLKLNPATTLAFGSGRISYVAMLTLIADTTRSFSVDSGVLTVDPSPMRVSSYTAAIAAIDALILKYATTGERQVSIDGMMVTFATIDEALTLRGHYLALQQRELGSGGPRMLRTRFT